MDELAFDPYGIKHHGLVYTTRSRVQNMDSLYLLRPLQKSQFVVSSKVTFKIHFLESFVSWNLTCGIHSFKNYGPVVLYSLNTHSLSIHSNHILADHDLLQSDFLYIQETGHAPNVFIS